MGHGEYDITKQSKCVFKSQYCSHSTVLFCLLVNSYYEKVFLKVFFVTIPYVDVFKDLLSYHGGFFYDTMYQRKLKRKLGQFHFLTMAG